MCFKHSHLLLCLRQLSGTYQLPGCHHDHRIRMGSKIRALPPVALPLLSALPLPGPVAHCWLNCVGVLLASSAARHARFAATRADLASSSGDSTCDEQSRRCELWQPQGWHNKITGFDHREHRRHVGTRVELHN